jgi:uncharacterized cupin superfamily protein
MNKVNQNDVAWTEQKSPQGKYHIYRRELTLALGGKKDVGTWGGGHPFDLELSRIPPGAINWPFHSHAAQWELFVFLQGEGELRTESGTQPLRAGDCVSFAPREPHQIRNTGNQDLLFYVVADNPQADVTQYPDSGKWFVKPHRKVFVMQDAAYYDGEE